MFGLDREQTKGLKRTDVTALKVRPVIVKDLTIFGTPRSQQKRKSRSRTRRKSVKAFDEDLNLRNSEYKDNAQTKMAKTPKSARSYKSIRSVKSFKSGKSGRSGKSAAKSFGNEQRHPSMPMIKHSKGKRRKKSMKQRAASYDSDEIIERLYNPAKFKRMKELKEKQHLKTKVKDKAAQLKRLHEQRRRNQEMLDQYRMAVIKKFGKEKGISAVKQLPLSSDDDN